MHQINNPVSHNASLCNRNVHISVTKWCIVGYGTGAWWDLWDWSIMGAQWWLLMPQILASPHQQLWYWQCRIGRSWVHEQGIQQPATISMCDIKYNYIFYFFLNISACKGCNIQGWDPNYFEKNYQLTILLSSFRYEDDLPRYRDSLYKDVRTSEKFVKTYETSPYNHVWNLIKVVKHPFADWYRMKSFQSVCFPWWWEFIHLYDGIFIMKHTHELWYYTINLCNSHISINP